MVERVARAISSYEGRPPDRPRLSNGTPEWTLYVGEARAAIAAMREPTTAMVERAAFAFDGLDADAWRIMIDAALQPPPQ